MSSTKWDMAGQNAEIGYVGGTLVLDVSFFDGVTRELTDPDFLPSWVITNSSDTVVASGQGNKISLGYFTATWFIPTGTPTGTYVITWTANINGVPVLNRFESFQVLPESAQPVTQQIIIEDFWLRQIQKVVAGVGVPNILLTDPELKEICVWPAMYEYFRKFPTKNRQQYPITGELIIPFPDNTTYGATDVRITDKLGGSSNSSSFWDIVRFQFMYPGSYRTYGSYGTRFNFNGIRQQALQQRQVYESMDNLISTYKYYVNYEDRTVSAFSTSQAFLVIAWAKYSLNFADVRYAHQLACIELASAYLLWYLADSGSIITDSAVDKNLNADALRARAEELYTRVITEGWSQYPDPVFVRAS